jgi:pimeloyl-ACP methyl ester carboxylesterase
VPVVLVHAFANDHALWRPQREALGDRYRFITPDLRGFGASMRTAGEVVSMDRYADDIVALLDELKVDRAVVGGISLGGYVALSVALRYPDRVSGLVLANTRAGADNPDWAAFREALVKDIEGRGALAVVENYGDKPFRSGCPRDIMDEVRKMIMRQPATGLVSGTRGMSQRPDRIGELSRITAPTLIIAGGEDQYIPVDDARVMHRGIAGSRLVELPHGGHLSNIDSTPEFNAALASFLESIRN